MVSVVTGAGGHIGTNLVRELLLQGRQVRVVDQVEPAELVALGAEFISGDVRDLDAMLAAFSGADTVFHLAAVISLHGSMGGLVEDVNVHGVHTVAMAARQCGARLVHCSSVHAFDLMAARGQVVDEDSPRATDPGVPAYDRSKAAGERQLQRVVADGLDAVVVNPTGVIGPLDERPSRMGQVFLALAAGRLPATVSGSFDWVDVRDVVQALLAAETYGRTGENYLVGGHLLSLRELAQIAEQVTGVAPPRFDVPVWFARIWAPAATLASKVKANPLLYTYDTLNALASAPRVNSGKAQRELGIAARPAQETVRDLYAFFEGAGMSGFTSD